MATDIAPSTNGIYGGQYGQPAELAASTPSGPAHASSVSQSSTTASTTATAKADPQEIGWYFVEQYYTNLSKSPERIHLFYNKKSQLVTGVEAEKVVPAVGIKAISEKIKSMDIQDCKVRVLNVDSQASFQNIVVQVIGEMSNKSEPHHKFVQTFVLAEQPNGYFVLNDIFRYLNIDDDEIVEDEPAEEHASTVASTLPDKEPAEAVEAPAVEHLNTEPEEVAKTDDDEPETNGADATAVDEVESETSKSAELEEPSVDEVAAPEFEKAAEPEPSRAASPPKPQVPVPAPAADAAPVRKTWASMVGTKAPAVPAVPVIAATAAPPPKAPKAASSQLPHPVSAAPSEPSADSDASPHSNGWQMADHGKKQKSNAQGASTSTGPTMAYIKNVTEKVDAFLLKETLERFGKLKYYDVARPRNCAFVEFDTPQGYAAAVAANPHEIGTEIINVEERRPRQGAYGSGTGVPPARGGFNPAGRGRGGAGVGKDSSRGGFQQRGKSGNVTPRGGRGSGTAV